MGDVKSLRPEAAIVSHWRRNGEIASMDVITNIKDAHWCRTRIGNHSHAPLSKGDIALLMEYSVDLQVREWCRKLVLETGTK